LKTTKYVLAEARFRKRKLEDSFEIMAAKQRKTTTNYPNKKSARNLTYLGIQSDENFTV